MDTFSVILVLSLQNLWCWKRRHILQHKGGSVEAPLLVGQKRSRLQMLVNPGFLFLRTVLERHSFPVRNSKRPVLLLVKVDLR